MVAQGSVELTPSLSNDRPTRFKVHVELAPRWPFGVPNGEQQIVPAGVAEMETHPILVGTFQQFGFNTLPRYREDAEAVRMSVAHKDWEANVRDNFVELRVESTRANVQDRVHEILDFVCGDLSVRMGTRFSYRIHLILGEDGRQAGTFRLQFGGLFQYELNKTRDAVQQAFQADLPPSLPYRKALRYFTHAQLLQEQLWELAEPGSQDEAFIAASSVLNHWKAITCLIGERPIRGWQHAQQIKDLGIDGMVEDLEMVGRLRNHWDVAHSRLDERGRELAKTELGKAARTAAQVIAAYRERGLANAANTS